MPIAALTIFLRMTDLGQRAAVRDRREVRDGDGSEVQIRKKERSTDGKTLMIPGS
jgi:hypothetical protein